jgi:hypothetical protein
MNIWKKARASKANNNHNEQDMHNHCTQYNMIASIICIVTCYLRSQPIQRYVAR